MRVWLIVALIANFAPLVSGHAEGAFINGVETFGGQVLDTSTWQIRYNSVVVQGCSRPIRGKTGKNLWFSLPNGV